jgi:hypothetical protein
MSSMQVSLSKAYERVRIYWPNHSGETRLSKQQERWNCEPILLASCCQWANSLYRLSEVSSHLKSIAYLFKDVTDIHAEGEISFVNETKRYEIRPRPKG